MRKNKLFTLSIIAFILLWIWAIFTFANSNTDTNKDPTIKTLPYYFDESDILTSLSLNSLWGNSSLSYYPGGYKIDLKSWKELTSFQIWNPALLTSESWKWVICTTIEQENCEYMKYRFSWFDSTIWLPADNFWFNVYSEVKWQNFYGQDYFEFIDLIKENATILVNWEYINYKKEFLNYPTINPTKWITLKTYWGDDDDSLWISYYQSKSKKFAIKTLSSEVSYLWIARTDDSLIQSDWTMMYEDMNLANWASVWVKWWEEGTIPYYSYIPLNNTWNDTKVSIFTIDMDSKELDASSSPDMYPYLDIYIWQSINWAYKVSDYGWNFYEEGSTPKPIYRISANKNWKLSLYSYINYPKTEDPTIWQEWLSWSFTCNWVSIWMSYFKSDCIDTQWSDFKWISQNVLNIPYTWREQVLMFKLKNASNGSFWNAFALAANIDLVEWEDIEITTDPIVIDFNNFWENTNSDLVWTNSVEVDENGVWDWENNFNNAWDSTNKWALHTYKTEVCNISTTETFTNTMLTLDIPNNLNVIWESWNISSSSYILNASLLDSDTSNLNRIDISSLWNQTNIWTLSPWDCKYVTFQWTVSTNASNWDIITFTSRVSSDTVSETEISWISNNVLVKEKDLSLNFYSNPTTGSWVSYQDYINYTLDITNTWSSELNNIIVDCPRFYETTETTCESWECWSVVSIPSILEWETWTVLYNTLVKSLDLWTSINEQCNVSFYNDTELVGKTTNTLTHTVVEDQPSAVTWPNWETLWEFWYAIKSIRNRLINSADWNPRPDGRDISPIEHYYYYTGSGQEYMYPEQSIPGSFIQYRWQCDPIVLPYTPNSVTYNINSTKSQWNDSSDFNFWNSNAIFNVTTQLPEIKFWFSQTELYSWTLTPTDSFPGSQLNEWYSDWWNRTLPRESTVHRWVSNWDYSDFSWEINWSIYLDKWQYVPVWTWTCEYIWIYRDPGWWEAPRTWYQSYTKYWWKRMTRNEISFSDSMINRVVVTWASAFWKTIWWNVHSNWNFNLDWTDANIVNLWETWYENEQIVTKDYIPPWTAQSEYMVTSWNDYNNVTSEKWWYKTNVNVPDWYWEIFDSSASNLKWQFSKVLLENKLFRNKVVELTDDDISDINCDDKQVVYYYDWDFTFWSDSQEDILMRWKPCTFFINWKTTIKSNILYDQDVTYTINPREFDEDSWLPILAILSTWDIIIDEKVNFLDWIYRTQSNFYTGSSTHQLQNFWAAVFKKIMLERKPPENYEREINEPSELFVYDDAIHSNTPPWLTELDDDSWATLYSVNVWDWNVER